MVVTYEYSESSAPTKIRTVEFFLGQSVTAGAAANWSRDFVLYGSEINVKKQYWTIDTSHVSTVQESILSTGSVNNQAYPARNFTDQTAALMISGYRMVQDLSSVADKWNIWSSSATANFNAFITPDTANWGGFGVKLVVVYSYTSEPA